MRIRVRRREGRDNECGKLEWVRRREGDKKRDTGEGKEKGSNLPPSENQDTPVTILSIQ